jgi:hypothetical protein
LAFWAYCHMRRRVLGLLSPHKTSSLRQFGNPL